MSNVREIHQPIYDGWKLMQFSDTVLAPISGRRPKGGASSESGTIPSIGGEHITNGGILDFSNAKFIPEDYFERIKFSKLEIGDILICKDGALAGKVAFYEKNYFHQAAVNEHVFILRPKNGNSAKFLFFSLQSEHGQNQIKRILTGSAQPGLTKNFTDYYYLNLPSTREQCKIADILSSVDAAIEQTMAIISQTKRVKTGLMKELFTLGIEHNEFEDVVLGILPKEWEVSFLGDQIKIIYCKHITPTYNESGVPIIRPQNIKVEGIDFLNTKFVSDEDYISLTEKHIPVRGDIVYSRNASFGIPAFVDTDLPFCIGQDIVVMTKKIAYTQFIYYALCSHLISKQLDSLSAGSTFLRINLKDIKHLLIPVPPIHEQEKIATILFTFDEKLKAEKKNRNNLEMLKKGLMQNLLNGRVRVKVDGHA